MRKENKRALADGAGAVHEVYSNNLAFFSTGADVRLLFSQVIPGKGDPFKEGAPLQQQQVQFSVEPRVAVTMSWHHAKLLHELLENSISRFEKLNGEIKENQIPR